MNAKVIWWLVRKTYEEWSEHKAPRLAAALSYYTVFSLAPLLLLAIAVAALTFGKQAAQGHIVREIRGTVGQPSAQAIEDMIRHASDTGSGILATVIGLGVLLFGASGIFGQLQDALNTIWEVTPKPGRGVWSVVKDRFLSFTMVFGSSFLLLVSLVVSAALSVLNEFLTPTSLPGGGYLWQLLNQAVSFGLITLLFALTYKVLPDAQIAWKHVGVGAAVTALLFTVGKYLIGLYLGQASVTSAFGAAGSLVVILLWVYYSSLVFLFGAEFTRVYALHYCGAAGAPKANAVAVTSEALARQGMPGRRDGEAAGPPTQPPQ